MSGLDSELNVNNLISRPIRTLDLSTMWLISRCEAYVRCLHGVGSVLPRAKADYGASRKKDIRKEHLVFLNHPEELARRLARSWQVV